MCVSPKRSLVDRDLITGRRRRERHVDRVRDGFADRRFVGGEAVVVRHTAARAAVEVGVNTDRQAGQTARRSKSCRISSCSADPAARCRLSRRIVPVPVVIAVQVTVEARANEMTFREIADVAGPVVLVPEDFFERSMATGATIALLGKDLVHDVLGKVTTIWARLSHLPLLLTTSSSMESETRGATSLLSGRGLRPP